MKKFVSLFLALVMVLSLCSFASAEDYSDWSTKDLKKECRERGIKVTKSMGKAELVKALEADDKE